MKGWWPTILNCKSIPSVVLPIIGFSIAYDGTFIPPALFIIWKTGDSSLQTWVNKFYLQMVQFREVQQPVFRLSKYQIQRLRFLQSY